MVSPIYQSIGPLPYLTILTCKITITLHTHTMTLALDIATNIIFGVLATVLTAATIVVALIKHRRAVKWNNGRSFAQLNHSSHR